MNQSQPTLMEILQPRRFQSHPKRTEATRTVLQPEIDKFEQFEAASGGLMGAKGTGRRSSVAAGL